MSKSRVFFRLIVGGYLAYTGFSLVGNALSERPENYILYTGIGVVFTAVGVVWCALALLKIVRHEYDDGLGAAPEIDAPAADEETEDGGDQAAEADASPGEKETEKESGKEES